MEVEVGIGNGVCGGAEVWPSAGQKGVGRGRERSWRVWLPMTSVPRSPLILGPSKLGAPVAACPAVAAGSSTSVQRFTLEAPSRPGTRFHIRDTASQFPGHDSFPGGQFVPQNLSYGEGFVALLGTRLQTQNWGGTSYMESTENTRAPGEVSMTAKLTVPEAGLDEAGKDRQPSQAIYI